MRFLLFLPESWTLSGEARRTGILSRESHGFLPNFSQLLHGPSEFGKVVPFIAGL